MKKKNVSAIKLMTVLLIITAALSCTNPGGPAQFREMNSSTDLPDEWSNTSNIRWTYDINGRGWSSPIITGDYVIFTTASNQTSSPEPYVEQPAQQNNQPQGNQRPPATSSAQPRGDQRPAASPSAQPQPQGPPGPPPEDTLYKSQVYKWEVVCLNLSNGREVWRKVAREGNPPTGTNQGNGYASETPATDGKKVFAYFGMAGVYCYDLKGNLLWSKDLGSYKTLNSWGTGSSPLLFNRTLYIQVDNEVSSFLVALDTETGEEKWRTERDEKTNYSTPVIWKNKVRTELVAGGKTVRSYDPDSGKLLWECKIGGIYNIPSSSSDEETLYTGNAGGPDNPGNLYAIKAGAEGDITLAEGDSTNQWIRWAHTVASTGNPSPLLSEGLLYVLESRGGGFSCFDAMTGELIYKETIKGVAACWGSPWIVDDKICFTDERGVTYIVKAGRTFELTGQNKISDRFWATPAIGDGTYIFKGVNKIYCVGE